MIHGLTTRDENGKLRRVTWIATSSPWFCETCDLSEVKHLTDEQKEAIKNLSSPSQLDVQDANSNFKMTFHDSCFIFLPLIV